MSTLQLGSDVLTVTPSPGAHEYNGQHYITDSNSARAQVQRITQSAVQLSTSGSSISFGSIPSWVKRITVMLSGVSTTGSAAILVQIGAASVETTGYNSTTGYLQSGTTQNGISSISGFVIYTLNNADTKSGIMTITNISGSSWVASGTFKLQATTTSWMGGDKTITGTLATLAVTTTDTFDAGSINIMYEG